MPDYISPLPTWLLVLLSLASVCATLLLWFVLSSQLATLRTSITALDNRVRVVETSPPVGSGAELAKRVAAVEAGIDRLTNTIADNYTQLSATVNQQSKQINDIRSIINEGGGDAGGGGGDTNVAVKALRHDVTVLQNTVSMLGVSVNEHKTIIPRIQQQQTDAQNDIATLQQDVTAAARTANQANVGVETVSMNLDRLTTDQRDTSKRLSNAQTKYDAAITRIDDYHNMRLVYAPDGMGLLNIQQHTPIGDLVATLISSPLLKLYDVLILNGMDTTAATNEVLHGALTFSAPKTSDGTKFIVICVSPALTEKYLFEFTRSTQDPTAGTVRLYLQSVGFDMHVVFDDSGDSVQLAPLLTSSVGAFALLVDKDAYTQADQDAALSELSKVEKVGHLPPFVYQPQDTQHPYAFLMFWDEYTRYGRAYSARSVLPLLGDPVVGNIWGIDYQLTAQFRPLR